MAQTSSIPMDEVSKPATDWRQDDAKVPKSDINALILDYLTMEGYPNAAAKFSKEANLSPQQGDAFVKSRHQIMNYIHQGDIETAIQALNEYDPQILDEDKALHFSLLRLQLVELIRSPDADIQPALKFATEQLGPRAPTDPKFLDDLEQTMALLMFPRDSLEPELAALLEPGLRRDAADDVNKAILERTSKRREAAIRSLVKMRVWAENSAREKGIDIPADFDVGLLDDSSANTGNDHEAMITT